MKITRQYGFTVYELLITMLVVGVILTIGVPNFREFTQNSRMSAVANDLHSSFQLARSEAARAKTNVTICGSADSMSAAADCNSSVVDGWIVFFDLDGNLRRAGPGENLIRVFPAVPPAITILTNEDSSYFSYAPNGMGRTGGGGLAPIQAARICDDRGNVIAAGGGSAARLLMVTPIGRATVLRDLTQIASVGGCP